MSVESKLDQLMARFKENVDKLDASSQRLANSKSRAAMEFKKNLAMVEKFNLPPEKFQMVFDTAQEMVNVCANFTPPQQLDQGTAELTKLEAMKGTGNAGTSDNYEQYKATVSDRIEQMEGECRKLDMLKELLEQTKKD